MKPVDVVIVGNGIIGCSIAYLLSKEAPKLKIALVGPLERKGSASLAAGAMLNVFGEVDETTFASDLATEKFELAIKATYLWKEWAARIKLDSEMPVDLSFGTNVYYDDTVETDLPRYNLIHEALHRYSEKHELVNGSLRIPNEGWIIPKQLFRALDIYNIPVSIFETAHQIHGNILYTSHKKIPFKKLVICNGAHSGEFINKNFSEIKIPRMLFGVGTGMILHGPSHDIKEVYRSPVRTNTCGIFIVPHGPNKLYIGASSWDMKAPESFPRFSSVNAVMNGALKICPRLLAYKIEEIFTGLRPVSEDGFPLVGEITKDIFVLTGTRRDGVHMSPLYAKDMVNRLLGYEPIVSEKFKPVRAS